MDEIRSTLQDSLPLAAILDPSAIERLVINCGEGGGEVVAALLGTLFDDAPRQLAALRQSLAGGVVDEVRRVAHTLKSHGITFGATFLAHLAQEVEALAKRGTLDGAQDLVEELEVETERACEALEAVRLELLEASGLQPAA